MEIAKVLGARVVTVCGSDVASQIAQYARISNVSKIVLGGPIILPSGPCTGQSFWKSYLPGPPI